MLHLETLERYFQLYSGLPDDQVKEWEPLLISAARQLTSLLKEGVDVEHEMSRLCSAAAGLAYSDYLLVSGAEDHSLEHIKVGDIALKSAQGRTSTPVDYRPLRGYFYQQISDLLPLHVGLFPIGRKEEA